MIDPQREKELLRQAQEAGIVEECLKRWTRRYGRCVDRSDLLEAANVALVGIVRDFDETRSGFAQFCRYRVDFAMLDKVRVEARHQRNDRAAQRASADLLAVYRAEPGMAAADQLRTIAEAVAAASFAAMTGAARRGGEDDLADREEYAIAHQVMEEALAAMPEPVREVMVMYYWDGKTLGDAAEELGIHRNTAERQHKKGLREIKTQLDKRGIKSEPDRAGGPRIELTLVRGGKKK